MTGAPLLLHVFPTFRVGGSQVRFAAIANHLAGKYQHAIVAMDGAYDCFDRLSPAVDAQRWDVPAAKRNTLGNVRAFRRILRARKPDLLITYNWGAIEWALANRPRLVPHIHIEDGFGPEEVERQMLRRVLTRRFALAKSTVVLPSRTLYRVALDRWRLPPDHVRHIPNGIDLARFSTGCEPIAVPPGAGPVIGTVAVLRPEKNIGRLLRAFASGREKTACRLVIAGDGAERTQLEALARQLLPEGSYVFIGQIDAVERVYGALDIFALSSDTEQMPTSLMEAMAAGLPVVSTDVGDVMDIVAAQNRPFVVPREGRQFAETLCRLATDEESRPSIGAANRAAAGARFGIARMFSDHDTLFSSLLNSGGANPAPRWVSPAA
ncbi:MAG: glycosyltransferase family 4 protein [Rhizomicrobium sp.]